MTDPTRQNRLADAPSPYLRQHADNPVNWQPWDEQALASAVDRDVPIFLSIGYAACHWCHVMAEESFANSDIAAILNDNFVPIKVDREERPAIDDVYMRVHQLVRGGGGWPLSVFLTPDLKPFYVATYLPPEPRRGQPGFEPLVEEIATDWNDPDERDEIESRADQWAAAVQSEMDSVPDTPLSPEEETLEEAATALVRQADRDHGGFGTGQKFPQPARLALLLRSFRRSGEEESLDVATETLDAMATGGLRDHLGGGFHRYCTDREWTEPHFEKMLYDNAALVSLYVSGFQVTDRDLYAEIAIETLEFLDTELRHPAGPFYSSLDARSGDEEGAYYKFSTSDLQRALSASGVESPASVKSVAREYWGLDETPGVPQINTSTETLAQSSDLTIDEVEMAIDQARDALVAYRHQRERPPRDEKILAGWNGLALSGVAAAGMTLDSSWIETAGSTLDTLREWLWDGDSLSRRYANGAVGIDGHLEDYAFLARGALDVFQATGEIRHLVFAVDLANALVDRFYDADREVLYAVPAEGNAPLTRPHAIRDTSTPSPVGVATATLLALDPVVPSQNFGAVAETVLSRNGKTTARSPTEHSTMVAAEDRLRRGVIEVTIPGPLNDDWRTTIGAVPEPDRILYHRPTDEATLRDWLDKLGLETVPPVWAERGSRSDGPTAYVCRRACSPPLTEPTEVVDWVNRFS